MTKKKLTMGSGIIAKPSEARAQSEQEASMPEVTARPSAPVEAPQRRRKAHAKERRSDQMSIRMTPSTRDLIEALAEQEGEPIAEIVERAIALYAGQGK